MVWLYQAFGSIVVRRPARGNSRGAVHVSMDRAFEGGVPVTKFLLWLVLLILCWPLALLALVLYPLVWLLLLPFRLIGIAVEGVFSLLKSVILLPSRVLAGPHRT